MLSYKNDTFTSVPETDLKTNDILERLNLQQAIISSWEAFKKEIGRPDLYLIGQEVIPHDSCNDRIDILAYDPNDNVPVIFELKRSKNRLQLLQGITYAAMISTWNAERFVSEARIQNSPDLVDIESLLPDTPIEKSVRIILIAEKFDPEVIIAADWLLDQFELDVTAIGINVFKRQDDLYFQFQQRFPLSELHDTYEVRSRIKNSSSRSEISSPTWEEVKKIVTYPWGSELIDICQSIQAGDPLRRRWIHLRKNYDGFKGISIFIRKTYVNIYILGQPEDAKDLLRSKFVEQIEIGEWANGYSFHVNTASKYQDLINWLKLRQNVST
jgi:hypothetical protein